MPRINTQTAMALMEVGTAVTLLEQALPKIDVAELPEPQKRGLTAALGRVHARIHLINQLADNHQPLPTPHAS